MSGQVRWASISFSLCLACWISVWSLCGAQVEDFCGFFAKVFGYPAVVLCADYFWGLLGVFVLFNLVDLLRALL